MKHNGLRASNPLQQLVAGGVDDTLSLWVWGGVVGVWMTPSHSQTPTASDCHRRYSDRLHQIKISTIIVIGPVKNTEYQVKTFEIDYWALLRLIEIVTHYTVICQ